MGPGRRRARGLTLREVRRREVAAARDAVADVLALSGLTDTVRAHRIVTEWRAMVGERIAARTWPDGLKDGVLWVRVASSAWLHELTLMRAQLLDGIARVLGPDPRAPTGARAPLVRELKLHLGARKQVDADDVLAMAQQARYRRTPPPAKPLPPPATGAAKARIDAETAEIGDDELRELIRAVRVRHDR